MEQLDPHFKEDIEVLRKDRKVFYIETTLSNFNSAGNEVPFFDVDIELVYHLITLNHPESRNTFTVNYIITSRTEENFSSVYLSKHFVEAKSIEQAIHLANTLYKFTNKFLYSHQNITEKDINYLAKKLGMKCYN